MRSEDLSTLFQPQTQDVGFHTGKVITWNDSNGLNSVEIAGTVITDLPMLNLGDVVALQSGDVVGVLRFMNTYFILGRIISAGSGQFASTALAVAGVGTATTNQPITTTDTTVLTSTVPVPTWADEAQILVVSTMTANNNGVNDDYFGLRTAINGVNGTQNFAYVVAGRWGAVTATAMRFITSPGSTITVESKIQTANFNFAAGTLVSHDGMIVFKSTV